MNDDILINFRKLEPLLKSKGKTFMSLREEAEISPGIVQKLRHGGGNIDTRTIQKVCSYLRCQPGDIMEFVDKDGTIPVLEPLDSKTSSKKKGSEK